jgi:hypothetical protein
MKYDVIIVDDPSKGIKESNLKHKPSGERCQHLKGNKPGEYSCAIHNESWYKETPCYQFTQIEKSINTPCRMGVYTMKKLISS